MTEQNKVKALQSKCGTYATAKHLKNKCYPLYMALNLLVYRKG